jgi:hypothetical protein
VLSRAARALMRSSSGRCRRGDIVTHLGQQCRVAHPPNSNSTVRRQIQGRMRCDRNEVVPDGLPACVVRKRHIDVPRELEQGEHSGRRACRATTRTVRRPQAVLLGVRIVSLSIRERSRSPSAAHRRTRPRPARGTRDTRQLGQRPHDAAPARGNRGATVWHSSPRAAGSGNMFQPAAGVATVTRP